MTISHARIFDNFLVNCAEFRPMTLKNILKKRAILLARRDRRSLHQWWMCVKRSRNVLAAHRILESSLINRENTTLQGLNISFYDGDKRTGLFLVCSGSFRLVIAMLWLVLDCSGSFCPVPRFTNDDHTSRVSSATYFSSVPTMFTFW